MSNVDELLQRLAALAPDEVQELAKRLIGEEYGSWNHYGAMSGGEQSTSIEPSQGESPANQPSSVVTLALISSALLRPLGEGVDQSPDICGGEPRIVRTRIPVWTLVQLRRLGVSEAEILKSYPTLRAEDLVHAWAYATWHRAEIDEQIRQHEAA